jgi:hypothetical protein
MDGDGAIWVEDLHEFFYKDASHTYRIGRSRLADNIRLVQHGAVMVRIEGALRPRHRNRDRRSLR